MDRFSQLLVYKYPKGLLSICSGKMLKLIKYIPTGTKSQIFLLKY